MIDNFAAHYTVILRRFGEWCGMVWFFLWCVDEKKYITKARRFGGWQNLCASLAQCL